jgi:hypothetical protein
VIETRERRRKRTTISGLPAYPDTSYVLRFPGSIYQSLNIIIIIIIIIATTTTTTTTTINVKGKVVPVLN